MATTGAGRTDGAPLEALLELLGDVNGLLEITEFRTGLVTALRRIVPAEWASLNDLGPDPADAVVVIDPPATPEQVALFASLAHENPLIAFYQRTHDGRAYRFSDVTTPAELHRTKLYRRFYGPIGVEHQIAFTLPAGPSRLLGIALSRSHRDFSDGERELLNRARPFLIQAYRNAVDHSRLLAQVGRVQMPAVGPDLASAVTGLVARGLTAREAEVLWWICSGQPRGATAEGLGISPRTVSKHLERAYRKLGVGNRAEAIRTMREAAAAPPLSG